MKIKVEPKQVSYLLNKLTIISKARFVQLITNAEQQTICFRGANESVQIITSSIKCEVDISGACGFDYYVLKDLISSLRMHQSITLDCSDSHILVTNEKSRSKYTVASVSANEVLINIEAENNLPKVTVNIDSHSLGKSLACVLKAAPKNDNRWYLNGINFEYCSEPKGCNHNSDTPVLYLVATDGSRLNMKIVQVSKGYGIDKNFVIPNNGNNPFVDYLLKLTAAYSGDLVIKFSDYFAEVFTPERDSIRTKLLDHGYINWKQLVNYNTSGYISLRFNRIELQSLLNRFKTLTLKFDPTCKVSIEVSANGESILSNQSKNKEVSASEVLYADNPTGIQFQVGFNSQFMLDLLSIESSEKVTLLFSGDDPSGKMIRYEGMDTFGILMPVKI